MADRFEAAFAELSNLNTDDSALAGPILHTIPVSGVAVSTVGDLLPPETVSASDEIAARVDELQFDLGEGPCWDALEIRGPVLEPDLATNPRHVWPAFAPAARAVHVAAIFAFPLLIGPLQVGVIDMYRTKPGELSEEHKGQTIALARVVGRHVLRRALRLARQDDSRPVDDSGMSRRLVHQAVGFVIAQLGVSAQDAELLIQGQAFADQRSMREVAEDIIARRLRFAVEGNNIEATW